MKTNKNIEKRKIFIQVIMSPYNSNDASAVMFIISVNSPGEVGWHSSNLAAGVVRSEFLFRKKFFHN